MPQKSALYFRSSTKRWPRIQKRRELLSVNMISLPLGDFRHLSHIGLDMSSDVFGDLTTLQRTSSLNLHGSQSPQDLHSNLSTTENPPPKSPCFLSPEEVNTQATESRTLPLATRHRKYQSLCILGAGEMLKHDGIVRAEEVNPEQDKNKDGWLTTRLNESKLNMDPRISCPPVENHRMVEEDLLLTLNFDLGPSILEDVLQVMDQLHQ